MQIIDKINDKKIVVIFGAGIFGARLLEHLSNYDLDIIFCDNNEKKVESKYRNKKVISVSQAIKLADAFYVIPYSPYKEEMEKQLLENGIKRENMAVVYAPEIPLKKLQFEIQLVEHCNLNCKYCTHFSPLAEKEFMSVETIERDFKQLSKLTGGEVERLYLLGGEPLLHPDIEKICILARKYFPIGRIAIITNGLLIHQKDVNLWRICKDNKIQVEITEYPVNVDYESRKAKLLSLGVDVKAFSVVKDFCKFPISKEGLFDKDSNFRECQTANACILLANGKLYPCPCPANIKHFNKRFDTNILEDEKDSVNIYEVKSFDEMMQKLAEPIPFCRFCDVRGRISNLEWEQSDYQMEEWME